MRFIHLLAFSLLGLACAPTDPPDEDGPCGDGFRADGDVTAEVFATIDPACTRIVGRVVLHQEDATDVGTSIEEITGSLIISDLDQDSVGFLPALTAVGGNVEFVDLEGVDAKLPSLRTVGGFLNVNGNYRTTPGDLLLPSLVTVNGGATIEFNSFLEEIDVSSMDLDGWIREEDGARTSLVLSDNYENWGCPELDQLVAPQLTNALCECLDVGFAAWRCAAE